MRCIKCNKKIDDKSKFCNWCGTKQIRQQFNRRSDGYFQKRITLPNGKRKSFFGKTEAEVEAKMLQFNLEEESKEKTRYTFRSVADDWSADASNYLAYNTYRVYKPRMERAVDYFGDTNISKIDVLSVNRYLNTLPKSYAQKTLKDYLSVLSLILTFACRSGLIEHNPCEYAKSPVGRQKTARRAPNENEISIINNSLNVEGGLIAYFFLYSGLRRGEALALTWGDIDFENHLISVNKSVYWESNVPKLKAPKTNKGIRNALLLDNLADVLKPLKKKKSDFIFADQGKLYTNKRFASLWKKYQNSTNLDLTPHCLRHGFATICYDANLDIKGIQDIIGHAQYSTTADIYTHLTDTHKQDVYQKLNDYVNSRL